MTAAALALLLQVGTCAADEAPRPPEFSGFGTFSLVHSSEDQADFASSVFTPHGAGYTADLSPNVDSRLGLQIIEPLGGQLIGVAQFVAEQRYDGSYEPQVEWLNLKYQFTPDFFVRVGRSVLNTFLYADSRKAAYSYPWVRPPLEAYALLPVTNSDGVDAALRLHVGDVGSTLSINYGQTRIRATDGSTNKAKQLWALSNTIEYGPLQLRLTYNRAHLTIPSLNDLFVSFRQFGPQGVAIADHYDADDKPFEAAVASFSYDPGRWFVMAEWGQLKTKTVLRNSSGGYVSAGWRAGSLTPYVVTGRDRSNRTPVEGLSLTQLPTQLIPYAAALNGALNAVLAAGSNETTWTVGTRWDFARAADLKFEYSYIDLATGSAGHLINVQPGFQPSGSVSVLSVSMDFVF